MCCIFFAYRKASVVVLLASKYQLILAYHTIWGGRGITWTKILQDKTVVMVFMVRVGTELALTMLCMLACVPVPRLPGRYLAETSVSFVSRSCVSQCAERFAQMGFQDHYERGQAVPGKRLGGEGEGEGGDDGGDAVW